MPLYYYPIEYGNSPVQISSVYFPTLKNNDK